MLKEHFQGTVIQATAAVLQQQMTLGDTFLGSLKGTTSTSTFSSLAFIHIMVFLAMVFLAFLAL